MELNFRIADMTSNLGDEVTLPRAGVTCIVGANNVGKSRLLMDIRRELLSDDPSPTLVLAAMRLEQPLPFVSPMEAQPFFTTGVIPPETFDWLEQHAGAAGRDGQGTRIFSARGTASRTTARDFYSMLTQPKLNQQNAMWFFADLGSSAGNTVSAMMFQGDEFDASYISMVRRSKEREVELDAAFHDSFGEHLIFDQATGANALRIGQVSDDLLDGARFTDAYTSAMAALPKLGEQGAGVQAFMGIVAPLVLGSFQVLLYDEPETYLHPPQARALGRYMGAKAKERDLQLIAVTHDRDFVIGLMESKAPLKFVRVAREGTGNRLSHVDTADVEWIWKKAVLRYSNVLDGLFYNRVVICEAEADCRFYSAVLDALLDDGEVSRRDADALFVSAAGKGGIAVRVKALVMLHVRTSVIVDFDFLSDDPKSIKTVTDALGVTLLQEDLDNLNLVKQDISDNDLKDSVKRSGLSALTAPRARIAAGALIERFETFGIYVLRGGTMESFEPLSFQEKEPWVDEILESEKHKTLTGARDLMRRVSGASLT